MERYLSPANIIIHSHNQDLTTKIDISHLAKGLYIIEVRNIKGERRRTKLIKE